MKERRKKGEILRVLKIIFTGGRGVKGE